MREFPVSRFVLVAFVMLIYGCQQPHNSNEANSYAQKGLADSNIILYMIY